MTKISPFTIWRYLRTVYSHTTATQKITMPEIIFFSTKFDGHFTDLRGIKCTKFYLTRYIFRLQRVTFSAGSHRRLLYHVSSMTSIALHRCRQHWYAYNYKLIILCTLSFNGVEFTVFIPVLSSVLRILLAMFSTSRPTYHDMANCQFLVGLPWRPVNILTFLFLRDKV